MAPAPADTIRILIATDNHVGYEERDPIRKDDSWKSFDEIMELAKVEDVDMVLLAGDLFHDNKPSRQSLYQVMRSLRKHCLGDRPCELEFLSDANLVFEGAFPHVNYEDPDINVSIPVFSIHGNHDDPSGEGRLCSLDLLQCAGLVNYYGRINEGDNIEARPILLQKGTTRLALYGLSNVRDERMFRTFRDGQVKWYRPAAEAPFDGAGPAAWFNLLAVHQNHHAHTATSYLPENVLPAWMHLVVWGHEHECLIDPVKNPETGFHVMQPGSSVATSLVPGEAARKHVSILSVTGTQFKSRKIPLRTVRPMVTRELVLSQDKRFKGLDLEKDNRQQLTKRLMAVVTDMIAQARREWDQVQAELAELAKQGHRPHPHGSIIADGAAPECPLPLIRLKVEYTPSDGGNYDIENPQRFSNRFVGQAANTNDVIFYYKKKKSGKKDKLAPADVPDQLDASVAGDEIGVEELVRGFLAAQSLKIFPQAPFGDAVNMFVTKDDRQAMETFVKESLSSQVREMLQLEEASGGVDLEKAMEKFKAKLEKDFNAGMFKRGRRRMAMPKPDSWDSDMEGHWDDQPGVWVLDPEPLDTPVTVEAPGNEDAAMLDLDDDVAVPAPPAKRKTTLTGTGRGRGRGGRGGTATRAGATKAAPTKRAPPAKKPRGGKKTPAVLIVSDDEDEEEDQYEDDVALAPRNQPSRAAAKAARQKTSDISDDEISDDDPFEPAPRPRAAKKR